MFQVHWKFISLTKENSKFDEKEEPNTMQMKGGNIFLSSSQNMMMLGSNGDELYHEYFNSPVRHL